MGKNAVSLVAGFSLTIPAIAFQGWSRSTIRILTNLQLFQIFRRKARSRTDKRRFTCMLATGHCRSETRGMPVELRPVNDFSLRALPPAAPPPPGHQQHGCSCSVLFPPGRRCEHWKSHAGHRLVLRVLLGLFCLQPGFLLRALRERSYLWYLIYNLNMLFVHGGF